MDRIKCSQASVIAALQETKGTVYLAARRLGVSPVTVYSYVKRFKKVRQALKAARAEMLDVGELKLFQAVQNGEAWAVCFLLKTRGKKRGYVERHEQVFTAAPETKRKDVEEGRKLVDTFRRQIVNDYGSAEAEAN